MSEIIKLLEDARRDGAEVRGYVMAITCHHRKCHQQGWALFLCGPYGILTADTELVFHYPGVWRQLKAFLSTRPGIESTIARVRRRMSADRGKTYRAQTCPDCDTPWGDVLLREACKAYFAAHEGQFEAGLNVLDVKEAFVLDLERLTESGADGSR